MNPVVVIIVVAMILVLLKQGYSLSQCLDAVKRRIDGDPNWASGLLNDRLGNITRDTLQESDR